MTGWGQGRPRASSTLQIGFIVPPMLAWLWFPGPPQPFGAAFPQEAALVLDLRQQAKTATAPDLARNGNEFNLEPSRLQLLFRQEGPMAGGVGGQQEHGYRILTCPGAPPVSPMTQALMPACLSAFMAASVSPSDRATSRPPE